MSGIPVIALRFWGCNVGKSFEYYWNWALGVFIVVIVVPFVILIYSTGTLEMMLSALACAGPLIFMAAIAGGCHLATWIKGKGA